MSHPYVHAENSARLFGGTAMDYFAIHHWFDESKSWTPDWRHRAFRHHREGIAEAVSVFGSSIINQDGKEVSVHEIGVQHVTEDLGFVPPASDWFVLSEHSITAMHRSMHTQRERFRQAITQSFPTSVQPAVQENQEETAHA